MTDTETTPATQVEEQKCSPEIYITRYLAVAEERVNGEVDKKIVEIKAEIDKLVATHPKFVEAITAAQKAFDDATAKVGEKTGRELNQELTALEKKETRDEAAITAKRSEIAQHRANKEAATNCQAALKKLLSEGRKTLKTEYEAAKKALPPKPKVKDMPDASKKDEIFAAWEADYNRIQEDIKQKFPLHTKRDNMRTEKHSNPRQVGIVAGFIVEKVMRNIVTYILANQKDKKRLNMDDILGVNWDEVDPAGFVRNLPCLKVARKAETEYKAETERIKKENSSKRDIANKRGDILPKSALLPPPALPKMTDDAREEAAIDGFRSLLRSKIIVPLTGEDKKTIAAHFMHLFSLIVVQFVNAFRDNLTVVSNHSGKKGLTDTDILFAVEMQYRAMHLAEQGAAACAELREILDRFHESAKPKPKADAEAKAE